MERIKQALDRARAERQASLESTTGTPVSEPAVLRPNRHHTRPSPASARICYTHSKTITLDREHLRKKRVILPDEDNPASTAYKVLRTRVLQRMRANSWKTLAITSPQQGNGKTLTAINLAINLARDANQTVLLVDLDLRHPSLGTYFMPGPNLGISDYLTDGVDIAELLINPGIERLILLPGNHSFTHSSEMLSSPKMVDLVREFKERYPNRLTLFDISPVLAGDDVLAFLPQVDAVMVVIEEGKTTKDEINETYRMLQGTPIVGTVLNKSTDSSGGIGSY